MTKHVVGRVSEIPPGQRRIVELEGRSIGVFNVKGTFYALRNACPHQSGPLCLGKLKGLLTATDQNHLQYSREGEIVRCPWHGWEFDVTSGRSIFNPHKLRVRAYEVTIEPEAADPSIETFTVTVERGYVVVHV
ncbi:MAG TPA: Rieske (2Fe-2S) protein [Chloroflexota bacterium]|nr:Rieske (2Fe-2S) protein [Chloroflexota bacterium]